jgi:type I restriction enzyme S subunit
MNGIHLNQDNHYPLRGNVSYYGGSIPWIKSGELNDGLIETVEEYITEEGLESSSAKVFPAGTVLIALYGATVGKTGILTFDAATNQAVCAIFVNEDYCRKDYLYWFLRHKRQDFLNLSFGGAQPNISQKLLRDTGIPLPDKNLQGQICGFLSIVKQRQSGSREELPNLPTPLEDIRRIVMQIEALAAGIAEARGLRQGAVGEAEALWASHAKSIFEGPDSTRWLIIDNIGAVRGGIQKSALRIPGQHPRRYLTVAHVQRNWIDTNDIRYFEVSDTELQRWRLMAGDVLVVEGNGSAEQIGRTALFRGEIEDCVHQNHIIRIRPDPERILPEYLNAYLNSPVGQSEMREQSRTSSGLFHLSVDRIRSIKVPVPNLVDQEKVISELTDMQTQLMELNQLQTEVTAELDAVLPSILDRAFRGEL